MNEIELNACSILGDALADLFTREANACPENDDQSAGRRQAYLACAEACIKATTRKMIILPGFDCEIVMRVPKEVNP